MWPFDDVIAWLLDLFLILREHGKCESFAVW